MINYRAKWRMRSAVLGLMALPAPTIAQTTITHPSNYTATAGQSALPSTANARSNMPLIDPSVLPQAALLQHNALPQGAAAVTAGASLGSADGIHIVQPSAVSEEYGNASPQSIAPYTTARASASVLGPTPTAAAVGVTSYPWRATGQLTFSEVGSPYTWYCTASLIAPGLLVTAAHCVYQYGTNSASGWHYNFKWVPAQYASGAAAPYGSWTALTETIPSVYYNGTDTCVQTGVICSNDIAIITLNATSSGALPGTSVGWYSYGWNGYSYTPSFGGASLASITQLGYPLDFDSGYMMERTDGVGSYWNSGGLLNTVLGSAMTGGSSGGPWLVNFGAVPSIDSNASLGNASNPQVVVGVTSWGYTTVGYNTQGASWFGQNTQFPNASYTDSHGVGRGAGNIGSLVASACSANFDHC